MFKKNTAVIGFGIGNFISTADGSTVTTGTPNCKRTLDGTAGACANAAAYDGTGLIWKIDLAAGDLNGDIVALSFTLAGCLPISYTIRTTTKLVPDLNDIAATAIVSAGAIATNSGAVSTVTTVTGVSGNVTGSVGSVAGNVTGSVGSLAAQAQTDVQSSLTAQGYTAARASYLDVLNGIIAAIWGAATRTLTAFGFSNIVADQVWDEAIAGHLTVGSTGKALDDAGATGDPLTNPVPGTYASGTAGAAIGTILTGRITIVSPMSQDGLAVKLVRGDDYLNADGRALIWTDSGSNWPNLTGATVRFKWGIFSKNCTVIGAGGAHQQVSLDLTSAETRVFENGTFNLEATLANTHVVTIVVDGDLIIRQDI